jgi:hypothetical protein
MVWVQKCAVIVRCWSCHATRIAIFGGLFSPCCGIIGRIVGCLFTLELAN